MSVHCPLCGIEMEKYISDVYVCLECQTVVSFPHDFDLDQVDNDVVEE